MNGKFEAIEELVGVPLGELGESVKPFLKALGEQSLPAPSPSWIRQARGGKIEARRYFNLLSLTLAQGESPHKKDELYKEITDKVVLARSRGNGVYSGRFTTQEYLARGSTSLNLGVATIRKLIRAMRFDLVFGYDVNQQSSLTQFFLGVTEEFLNANIDSLPPSLRPEMAVDLNMKWDKESPQTFYRELYQKMGRHSSAIKIWMPYEAAVMQYYYTGRIELGSPRSDFDAGVMALRTGRDITNFARRATQETGIYLDRSVIFYHRNAIVYGQPTI